MSLKEHEANLRERRKGFDHELAHDSDGDLIVIVWQAATMRDNFERFGGHISLDTMKRGIDKWLWPRVAIVAHDETRKACLGCEGLMIGEKKEAYDFMCKFLIGRSPDKNAMRARGSWRWIFLVRRWHTRLDLSMPNV